MALSMVGPREGKMEKHSHKFGAKNTSQRTMQSSGMKSSPRHAYRSKVIGNLKEGQGYADKRKRRFLNNYQKLQRKQRLQSERKQSATENETMNSDINLFAQNIQRDAAADSEDIETNSKPEGSVKGQRDKEASKVPNDASTNTDKGDKRTGETGEKKKRFKKRGGKKNTKNRFTKAQEEFTEKRRVEEMRVQTLKQQQTERAEAMERYSKKKMEQHQKLKKKTRRGQPLMKYHMEALLDKIKAQGT